MNAEEFKKINEEVALKLGMHTALSPSKIVSGWCHSHPEDFPHMPTNKLPDFSHDIRAAWEIVEFLTKADPFRVYEIELAYRGFECHVWIHKDPLLGNYLVSDETASTAPLAICKAFLNLSEKEFK